jgi:hypothetical protein
VCYQAKILFVGDPAQLPPVGEDVSSCWGLADRTNRCLLKEVRRFDNQLLEFATLLRENIRNSTYPQDLEIPNDFSKEGGIRRVKSVHSFIDSFLSPAKDPSFFDNRKILGWRNVTVNEYNQRIRRHLNLTSKFAVGERIAISSPVKDYGTVTHTIDTEFLVREVSESFVSIRYQKSPNSEIQYVDVPIYALEVAFPESPNEYAYVLKVAKSEASTEKLFRYLADLAHSSGYNKTVKSFMWKQFWEAKDSLHLVRYNYSQTVHRSQGSTYKSVFVDARDILSNPNKSEALRCLYVAFTRPSKFAISY